MMFRFTIKQPFKTIATAILVFAKMKFLLDICNHKLLLDTTEDIIFPRILVS